MATGRFLTLAALAAIPLFAIGCSKKEAVDSRDVATHAMSLELKVTNNGTKSRVEAAIHVGTFESLTYATLTDGEQLILTDPTGDKRALSSIGTKDAPLYGAEVQVGGGDYLLDFIRVKGAASALGNKATLPAAFTLAAPTTAPRNQPLTFTWNAGPSGDAKMSYSLSGECVQTHGLKSIIGDPGTFTVNAGEIQSATGKDASSCKVTLTVTRTTTTNECCSAEFGQKSIARGIQERTVTFDSTP